MKRLFIGVLLLTLLTTVPLLATRCATQEDPPTEAQFRRKFFEITKFLPQEFTSSVLALSDEQIIDNKALAIFMNERLSKGDMSQLFMQVGWPGLFGMFDVLIEAGATPNFLFVDEKQAEWSLLDLFMNTCFSNVEPIIAKRIIQRWLPIERLSKKFCCGVASTHKLALVSMLISLGIDSANFIVGLEGAGDDSSVNGSKVYKQEVRDLLSSNFSMFCQSPTQFLEQKRFDIHELNRLLQYAALAGAHDLVRLLLENGADINFSCTDACDIPFLGGSVTRLAMLGADKETILLLLNNPNLDPAVKDRLISTYRKPLIMLGVIERSMGK
jgi:hypothetical protein